MTLVASPGPTAPTQPRTSYPGTPQSIPTDARNIPPCPVCRTDCTDTLGHALAVFTRTANRDRELRAAQMFVVWPDSPAWTPADTMAVAA